MSDPFPGQYRNGHIPTFNETQNKILNIEPFSEDWVDLTDVLTRYKHLQEVLNEGTRVINMKIKPREMYLHARQEKFKAKNDGENSSSDFTSSSLEEDEKIDFDFNSIEKELSRELTNEWVVETINVSRRFRKYQRSLGNDAFMNGTESN
ncbi:hypothetical protein C1646_768967 [Rhizophagus diaphanus]|nr:hypothetical protein C1646_768967 [Rhizophagus diaphanus] [Rhizophagus sp. MUCL 43196]